MLHTIRQWLIPPERQDRRAIAFRVAWVLGCLALAASAVLLWDYSRRLAKDPLETPRFKQLKAELARDPKNERIKQDIRDMDLQLRQTYFKQRALAAHGASLLLFGILGAVLAGRIAATVMRRLPYPKPRPIESDPVTQSTRFARWAVLGLAVVLVVLTVGLNKSFSSVLPDSEEGLVAMLAPAPQPVETPTDANKAPQPDAPKPVQPTAEPATNPEPAPQPAPTTQASSGSTQEASAQNWPRFRGPDGSGVTTDTSIPTTWDVEGGKNVVWKAGVSLPGNNSPIAWDDRIFLSGATEEKRQVFCYSASDGKLLWQKDVPNTREGSAGKPTFMADTGLAASTMATDGQRAYAMFVNGDIVAFDFQGKQVWLRGFGVPKNEYGHAASLATYKNNLIVQFDQGEAKDALSKIMALDGATGKTLWETPRKVSASWSSPIVIRVGQQDQIVTMSDPWVIAYDPADGKEIWRANCLRQDVGPSPVYFEGTLYIANQFPCLSAVKADGKDDVTKTHVLWKGEDGLPDTCSPLAMSKFVLLLSSEGTLTCYDRKDGKKLWEKDFDSSFKASPSLVSNRVYLIGFEGKCWVVEPDDKDAKQISEVEMKDEELTASPVFQRGRMYLRGKETLYCIGAK